MFLTLFFLLVSHDFGSYRMWHSCKSCKRLQIFQQPWIVKIYQYRQKQKKDKIHREPKICSWELGNHSFRYKRHLLREELGEILRCLFWAGVSGRRKESVSSTSDWTGDLWFGPELIDWTQSIFVWNRSGMKKGICSQMVLRSHETRFDFISFFQIIRNCF